MKQTVIAAALSCLAAVGLASCSSAPPEAPAAEEAAAPASDCAPAGNLSFVCGPQSPEDIVEVPGTRWLVASGMVAGSGLHLVDTAAKTATALPLTSGPADARYAACPGPLDLSQAVLHGLALRPADGGRYTLYATNHGGRESVEVFTLDAQGASPTAAWAGCVLMPDDLEANSVAAFTDGTLLTTVVVMPGFAFEDLFAGRNTGAVFQWRPGDDGFTRLPGTELPGNNGIETSPDDTEFYVAASGAKTVTAFSRANPSTPLRTAQLTEFAPDNVRLQDGRLLAAGMIDDEPSCGGAPKTPADIQCPRGYIAVAIDPATMAVTEIARGPVAPPYTGTATALVVGGDVWLSSFNADRLAWRPLAP
ncbi:MAG: hypothetical protein AB7G23_16175 [Vicinamibacterales bacterium]